MRNWIRWGALGLGLTASTAWAADANVSLQNEGPGGAALTANVDIDVVAPDRAVLNISNTAAPWLANSSDSPRLFRLGFNLASDVAPGCLELAGSPKWQLKKGNFFCKGKWFGGAWGKKNKGCSSDFKADWGGDQDEDDLDLTFDYQIRAKGWGWSGLEPGESIQLELRVKPQCAASFQLTPAEFADAEQTTTGGGDGQWAAKFAGFALETTNNWWWGKNKTKLVFKKGCAPGDVELPTPSCNPDFTWGELVASSADLNGLPSDFKDPDSRAGSLQLLFNGGVGFDPTGQISDAPHEAATITLRNGASAILEQWQVNRRYAAAQGCEVGSPFPRCWVQAALDAVDGLLRVVVPNIADSSNDGFDESGQRVTVGAELLMDYSAAQDFTDNGHQTFLVTWEAPFGIESAQLLLRGRYDSALDGLGSNDVLEPLFRRNVGSDPDYKSPSIFIVEETATSLTIGVNVEGALSDMCLSE
jgi:hypothetical protein